MTPPNISKDGFPADVRALAIWLRDMHMRTYEVRFEETETGRIEQDKDRFIIVLPKTLAGKTVTVTGVLNGKKASGEFMIVGDLKEYGPEE